MRIEEPAALKANGWSFYEKCRCSGILKYRYRNIGHPDLELEWHPKSYQFRITYRGTSTKVPLTKVAQMGKILKEL